MAGPQITDSVVASSSFEKVWPQFISCSPVYHQSRTILLGVYVPDIIKTASRWLQRATMNSCTTNKRCFIVVFKYGVGNVVALLVELLIALCTIEARLVTSLSAYTGSTGFTLNPTSSCLQC